MLPRNVSCIRRHLVRTYERHGFLVNGTTDDSSSGAIGWPRQFLKDKANQVVLEELNSHPVGKRWRMAVCSLTQSLHYGFIIRPIPTCPDNARRFIRLSCSWLNEREAVMPITANYLFIASMDVAPEKDGLFHKVYNDEHVPSLLRVPGVISATRLEAEPLTVSIGGETRSVVAEGEPRYTAIFEIESPEVLVSPEWAEAVEAGRWPTEVRPYTKNRRHVLRKVM